MAKPTQHKTMEFLHSTNNQRTRSELIPPTMAHADEVSPHKACLTNREDWETWIVPFQAMAKAKDVWESVDPKGTTVLTEPTQPKKPNQPRTTTPRGPKACP